MHIWYEYHDETHKMRIKLNMQTLKRGVKKNTSTYWAQHEFDCYFHCARM